MRFVFKKRPIVMEGPTKAALDQAIQHRFRAMWGCGGGGGNSYSCLIQDNRQHSDDILILVNYEKFRRRASVGKKVGRGERGPTRIRMLTRAPHWKAYIYTFYRGMVANAVQGPRTFKVELKPF